MRVLTIDTWSITGWMFKSCLNVTQWQDLCNQAVKPFFTIPLSVMSLRSFRTYLLSHFFWTFSLSSFILLDLRFFNRTSFAEFDNSLLHLRIIKEQSYLSNWLELAYHILALLGERLDECGMFVTMRNLQQACVVDPVLIV